MISQGNKAGFRNPWLLGMLGLIVLVLGVNSAFIWFATHNRSSLVERDYKTKDRKAGEEVLMELGTRQVLGWQTSIKAPSSSIVMNAPAAYEISVVDREGVPVSGTMKVEVYRPSDDSKDFTVPFTEVSPGNYRGTISFPLKGFWELHIGIKRGADEFSVSTDKFSVATAAQ